MAAITLPAGCLRAVSTVVVQVVHSVPYSRLSASVVSGDGPLAV
jgi:hypothetical protein